VNGLAQARGKAGKFVVHAVFGYGWFSATADQHYTAKRRGGKRIATGFAAQDCQWCVCPSHWFLNEQTVLHHHRD
jgi:hypothetical protein